jgi:hypothetical protein
MGVAPGAPPTPLGRRRLLHGLAAGAGIAALPRPALAQASDGARAALAGAATAFLGALTAAGRRRAVFAFDDRERLDWHYVPRRREGLAFKDMAPPARAAAHELLRASLSAGGYAKAVNIIRLEDVLRQLETFGGLLRDPENYSVTVFGAAGAGSPWGWRLEGHHLSLNFTLVPGKPVAVTPAFLGANPAEVPKGPLKGLRTLAREQELGLALARSMDARQRALMLVGDQSLGDIASGPGRGDRLGGAPVGVPLGAMTSDQRGLAVSLIEEYARNMRAEVAEEELRRLREAGLDRIQFAWAGSLEPRQAHYYRLHGPAILIEYDNTQNDANHIHTVWRDPVNDFGLDLLRAHYLRGHRHA